jgi:sugar phosphate isomerase/epimerase
VSSPHIHIPFNRIPEYLDFIKKKDLNLEIYFGADVLDTVGTGDIVRLRDALDYHPSLSLHGPFMDLSPGAVDAKVRDVTMQRFSHLLDIAAILGPRVVVFHSGYEKWKYALNVDVWLEKSLETWRPLDKKASAMGVKIAIENIFEDEPSNLARLMESMASETFGVCFDTGHCNLFSRVGLETWLDALNPHIIELHLHDNDRTSDQHLPMGRGTFDFGNFFRLLGERDCVYTVEAHSPEDVLESIDYLTGIKGTSAGSSLQTP